MEVGGFTLGPLDPSAPASPPALLAWRRPRPDHPPTPPAPAAASAAVPNAALLFMLAYTAYYVRLEPVAGASWGVCLGGPMWLAATAARQRLPHAWAWAAALHVLSWAVQVGVGHGLIEGRKPALLDSFWQAVGLAALFAWLEGLFALGYRPALKAELDARVGVALAAEGSPGRRRPLS